MKKEWNDVREFHEKFGHPVGLEADELFDIVQKANMAKLWPDGKPHYNPKDGKVIKPDGWEDPAPKIKAYIDAVIARKAQK